MPSLAGVAVLCLLFPFANAGPVSGGGDEGLSPGGDHHHVVGRIEERSIVIQHLPGANSEETQEHVRHILTLLGVPDAPVLSILRLEGTEQAPAWGAQQDSPTVCEFASKETVERIEAQLGAEGTLGGRSSDGVYGRLRVQTLAHRQRDYLGMCVHFVHNAALGIGDFFAENSCITLDSFFYTQPYMEDSDSEEEWSFSRSEESDEDEGNQTDSWDWDAESDGEQHEREWPLPAHNGQSTSGHSSPNSQKHGNGEGGH